MFKYEPIALCEFCDEPAIWKTWWGHNNRIKVCQKHFEYIKECEEDKDGN